MFHPFPDDRMSAIARAQKYVSQDPLFLDTETTGLSDMDEICEIAIVDLTGQVLINSLVKPIKPIPLSATDIHGISQEMVQRAPTFRELLPELDRILKGRIVIIYNAEFDMGKITRSAQANGFNLSGKDGFSAWWWSPEDWDPLAQIFDSGWYCAMELYAAHYGDWNEYHGSYRWQRLSTALQQCKINLPQSIHRAHADAEMTRRLVLHMAQGQLTLPAMNPNEQGEPNEHEG